MLLNQELKNKLNQSRVLTMSNNRKCDYLIVDCGKYSTFVMGVKNDNPIDIVFIKELFCKEYNELVEKVEQICCEFNIELVITDMNGIGLGFYETFQRSISSCNIDIRGIKNIKNDIVLKLKQDIDNCNIRFMQTYEFAKNSYKKTFFGYSEVMNFHKETDKLFNEIDNISLNLKANNNIRLELKDKEVNRNRFNCLMTYYNYKYNIKNIEVNKIDLEKEKEIQRRMANYYICQGMFYKYLYKAIDNKGVNIIFYHNGWNRILKFKNMIGEDEFKKNINCFIKYIKAAKSELEIIFNNDSRIKFVYASDSARGHKYDYAVIDTEISREVYNNIILTSDVYWYTKEQKHLSDEWNIEFMDFN